MKRTGDDRYARIEVFIEVELGAFRANIRRINHEVPRQTALESGRPALVIRIDEIADHQRLRIQW